jgi:hypothetical protein
VADAVRVGLDRFVLDPLGSEALEEGVEPGDGEGDPPRARLRRVGLDEEPGVLVDLPEDLVPDATVRGSPEEPRVPIDARLEIGYRHTGVEIGERAHCCMYHSTNRVQRPSASKPSSKRFENTVPFSE